MDQCQHGPADDFDGSTGVGLCPFAEFEYRPETSSYDVRYDEVAIPPSIAVIGTMSHVLATEPEDLVSLGESVDLEALDALLSADAGRVGSETSVSFRYYDHEVTVDAAGGLTVREPATENVDAGTDGRASSTSG